MTSITFPIHAGRSRTSRRVTALVLALAVSTGGLLVATAGGAQAAATAVPLGTAGAFAVLAGSGITNTGTTTITGDVGTDPKSSITDNGAMTITGETHAADEVSTLAKTDLVTGYNNAAAQSRTADTGAELGGQTLVSGVYGTNAALGLTGTVTLDGAGRTDGVWVFQAGSTLITASSSRVLLTNGATPCNVYWQVGSSATLGTGTSFVGTILASASITATTGATINGRLLAQSGAVTLDTNVITRSNCADDSPDASSASSAASSYQSAAVSSSISSAASAASSAAAAAAAAQAAAEAAAAAAQAADAAAAAEAAAAAASAAQAALDAAAIAQAANDTLAALTGYGQVVVVPVGSVDTGDGSLSRGSAGGLLRLSGVAGLR